MLGGFKFPSAPLERGVFKCDCGAEHEDDGDLRQCDATGCDRDTCGECALRCDLCQYKFCPSHAVSVPHPGKNYDDIVCGECIARIDEARRKAA
jgi:hypothetical protein